MTDDGRILDKPDPRRLFAPPGPSGALVALLFWSFSLTPTLIPRPWVMQVVVSTICVVAGYAIGAIIGGPLRNLLRRRVWRPTSHARRWAWVGLGVVGLAFVVVGAIAWRLSQNGQRHMMGMPHLDAFAAVLMAAVTVLATCLLVIVGRLIRRALARYVRWSRRLAGGHTAGPVVGVVALGLVVVLCGGFAFEGLGAFVSSNYGAENKTTDPGVTQPTSPTVSGSPASLVPWNTLGRQGRTFVSEATPAAELADFAGGAATKDPVRVYAGVNSADTLQARADLAVRDLERAGGFDRAVLVVWIPTGTGWMISQSAEAIEQLYHGDTAIVGIQYSYLPSLFTVPLKPGIAFEAGSALFNAVEQHVARMPAERRPKLLLFGKSLGTEGVEAPFAAFDATSSVGNLAARADGALLVGAKYVNPLLSQLTRERDPGSPVWAPVFDNGRTVRFVTGDPDQRVLTGPWPAPRIVYLQHPSDPVPYWGIESLWRPPAWMDRPRAETMPQAAVWFPIVSAVQALSDQVDQLSTPPGFGHNYATDYVQGWTLTAPPNGWTTHDTERLEDFLGHHEHDVG